MIQINLLPDPLKNHPHGSGAIPDPFISFLPPRIRKRLKAEWTQRDLMNTGVSMPAHLPVILKFYAFTLSEFCCSWSAIELKSPVFDLICIKIESFG